MGAEEDRQYAAHLANLRSMVDAQRRHLAEVPNCPDAPLCMGADVDLALVSAMSADPGYAQILIVTAVGELRLARDEIAGLRGMLRVAAAQLDRMASEAEAAQREAEAQIRSLRAIVGELQGRLTVQKEAS